MAEEDAVSGWIVALIAIVVVAIAATLLPFTVPLLERAVEVADIVVVLLFSLWVQTGGLQRSAARRAEFNDSNAIRRYPQHIEALNSISRRAWELFGEGSAKSYAFDGVGLSLENGWNALPAGATPLKAEEQRAADAATSIRRGWQASADTRTEIYNEAGRLLYGSATTNTREFRAASNLVNGFLRSAFAVAVL